MVGDVSAFGTKRTSSNVRSLVAIGGKADVGSTSHFDIRPTGAVCLRRAVVGEVGSLESFFEDEMLIVIHVARYDR